MTEHTPGPWIYHWTLPQEIRIGWIKEHGEKPRTSPAEFLDSDGHNLVIARLPLDRKSDEPTEEMKANARLIASAPDLLAALQRLQQSYYPLTRRKSESHLDASLRWSDEQDKAHDAARTAIAKARGD